jgi:hypothetical protein
LPKWKSSRKPKEKTGRLLLPKHNFYDVMPVVAWQAITIYLVRKGEQISIVNSDFINSNSAFAFSVKNRNTNKPADV